MAIETVATAAREISETAPMSPDAKVAAIASGAVPARPRGWLRRLIPREYLPRTRRWKLGAAASTGGAAVGRAPSRLASSLSMRWKRLPAFSFSSLTLRSGSASAVVDEVTFRVMYVVEAVVLGLGLSCFFLCCGCHL